MEIRTCQFNDSFFPIMDGVGMTAHNYAFWLNEKFGKSVVIAPKVKGYKDQTNYKVYRFKSLVIPGMNPYRVGLPLIDVSFKKAIQRKKFDILHAHCPFVSGQLALKMAQRLNIPLVATFHSKYREDFQKVLNNDLFVEFLMKITLDFYHQVDHVWVPNRSTGETLRQYGYKGIFEIMPNGTDIEIPDKSQHVKYRKKGLDMVGFGSDEFVLLFVGQHRWEKNVRMILDALRILKSKEEAFRMIFVGEGYAEKEMKKLARLYDLQDHVVFTGVVTDRKKIRSLYACSDLFIFPSLYDNSPLVIQEAAAFDIPSVLVKESSAAEEVIDRINGFLIDNNPVDLAATILDLKNHPEAIRRAGEGARRSIYHTWESIVDDVYLRYVEIIKEKKEVVVPEMVNDEMLV